MTFVGGYLSAGGAGAVNHYYDRDIDARMARTADRPVPAGRIAPARGAVVRHRARPRCRSCSLATVVNLLSAVLALSRVPGLRARLHALAQAPDGAEHRHRRRGRRRAAARRLGGRHRRDHRHVDLPVRDRLLLDAAALLGAVAAHEGRVRGGRRADAARRPRRGRDAAPDPAVLRAAVRRDAAAVLRRRVRRRSTSRARSCSARCSSPARSCCYRRADRRSALRLYLFSLAYLAALFAAMVVDAKV